MHYKKLSQFKKRSLKMKLDFVNSNFSWPSDHFFDV